MTIQEALNIAQQRQQAGDLASAEAIYRQILQQHPALAEIHSALGNNLFRQGRSEDSILCFSQAVALLPANAEMRSNLGIALFAAGRLAQSAAELRHAAALAPDKGDIRDNLAAVLYRLGELDEAEAAGGRAIALRPQSAGAYSNLAAILQAKGKVTDAIAAFDEAVRLNPANWAIASSRIMARQLHPAWDSGDLLADVKGWNDRFAQPAVGTPRIDRGCDRTLRVGYVSPDFRDQVIGRNILPLLREHDRARFKIHCYSAVARPDAMTGQFKSLADEWRDISRLGDWQAAELIRQDRIDILVDLSLHTPENRLGIFTHKPAPVQITFAGYPGGTGLAAMDWRLTDGHLDPPGEFDGDYVEQSHRLAGSFWCFDPAAMEADGLEVAELPALANGHITFGCLNSFCKISERIVPLWKRIMQNTRGSRLIILAPRGEARERFLHSMELSPDRVDFITHQPRRAHLCEFNRIDLCLDTLPYNGHTTSLESLWMGVPVVTLVGRTVVGRAGLSQLTHLGLSELVARDDEGFVRLACDLAGDPGRLSELRRSLRGRMSGSVLTDGKRFARDIESAYRTLWGK